MKRFTVIYLIVILLICCTALNAQNEWEQQGIPLAYEQPTTVTADHISSANNPTGTSITYVCDANGLYVSTNQGSSWSTCDIDFGPEVVVAYPSDGREAWFGDLVNGTYHTTNSGGNWNREIDGLDNLQVRALAINPEDEDVVIAGCLADANEDNIFMWRSATEDWIGISDNTLDDYLIDDVAILDNGSTTYFVVASNRYIWITDDVSLDWIQIDDPPPGRFNNITDIEVSCDTGNDYIYVGGILNGVSMIARYDIDSDTWTGLQGENGNYDVWIGGYFASPYDYFDCVIEDYGLYYQVNSWSYDWVDSPEEDYRINGFAIDYYDPDIIYTCTEKSFYKLDKDDNIWVSCVTGMDYVQVGLVGSKGDNVAAAWNIPSTGYEPYYYESEDDGEEWSNAFWLNTPPANVFDIEFTTNPSINDEYILLGRYFESGEGANQGNHSKIWPTTIGDAIDPQGYFDENAYIYDIDPHPLPHSVSGEYNYIVGCGEKYTNEYFEPVTTDCRFLISDDGGDTFDAYNDNLPVAITTVWAVAIDPTEAPNSEDATYVIATNNGVYYTDDNADSWTSMSTGLSGSLTFSDIQMDDDGDALYLAASDGFYIWSSAGGAWQESSDGIPTDYQNIIDIEWIDDNIILCVGEYSHGDHTKVFCSGDAGDNWFDMTGDLPTDYYIRNIRHSGDYLYVGTDEGIYRFEMEFAAEDITSTTTWDGNIWLVNNIEVSSTLTLDNTSSDCEIYVMGDYTLTIDGGDLVTSNASEQNKVTFQAGDGISGWGGIRIEEFDDTDTHTIQYLHVEDADYGIRVVPNVEAEVNIEIRHCRLQNNVIGIAVQEAAELEIEYCTAEDNSEHGIYLFDLPSLGANDFHYVTNCELIENGYSGLYLNRCPASLRVTDNYINDNLTVSAAYGSMTCYNSNSDIYGNLIEEANGDGLAVLNAGAPSLNKEVNTIETSAGGTYACVHTTNAFPVLNNAYNNLDNTNGTNEIRVLDSTAPSVTRTVENNYWGSSEPESDWFSPSAYFDYTPYLGSEQTLGSFSYGTASIDDGPFTMLATGIAAESQGNFSSAYTTLKDLVENYIEVEDAVCQALPHILTTGIGAEVSYDTLYAYFNSICQENQASLIGKTTRHLRNDCWVAMGEYSSAITDYESIVSNPPTLADSLFALLDIEQIYLIMESLGVPITQSGETSGPHSLNQYHEREAELLSLLNGDRSESLSGLAAIPASYSLQQNYPNPFNPNTQIMFSLPVGVHVRLNVYDINGRLVASLIDGTLEAGTHVVEFKAEDIASGIYIYQMTTDSYSDCKKMVLVK